MGYIMFGLSLFPASVAAGTVVIVLATSLAITGTVLHIISHALSKGLLFLGAGGIMHQTEKRDITKMGGLASKMPFTAVSSIIAALSIGGAPPFACFISEFLIFVGAFQIIHVDSFYSHPHCSYAHRNSSFAWLHAEIHIEDFPWTTKIYG